MGGRGVHRGHILLLSHLAQAEVLTGLNDQQGSSGPHAGLASRTNSDRIGDRHRLAATQQTCGPAIHSEVLINKGGVSGVSTRIRTQAYGYENGMKRYEARYEALV